MYNVRSSVHPAMLKFFKTLKRVEKSIVLIVSKSVIFPVPPILLSCVQVGGFSELTLVSSTNKTDHKDITEVLLKVDLDNLTTCSTRIR